MSTEVKKDGEGTPPPADEFKNLKAEFNRKIDKVNDELKKSNQQLMEQLQSMLAPKPPKQHEAAPADDELEELLYKNPKLYTQKIEERAEKRLEDKLNKRDAENQRLSTAITAMYQEFPELNKTDGELYKLAISKQTEMAKEYGNSVATMKAAVAEAALELGVKPMSKRERSEDDFTVDGRGSESEAPVRKRGKKDELPPNTALWAEALGADLERVKARHNKRKNYTKYE